MNILFISSEAYPFAKTGGLADVIGSLPGELNKNDIDARVMLPLYKNIKDEFSQSLTFHGAFTVRLSWRDCYCGLFSLEHNEVVYYFIDNEQYFYRDGLYGHFDDGERFAYFSKAALEALKYLDFEPQVLHLSDWQTALVPVFLKLQYQADEYYRKLSTVFTIHNIEYQGKFGIEILKDVLGIDRKDAGLLMMDGDVNYMKGAIVACDRLTTVSKSYSEEIKYPFFSHGLHSIINENSYKLSGIINGIDYKLFNPWRDKALAVRYSKNSSHKKEDNKIALMEEVSLDYQEGRPLIGMVGRLAEHKGIPLVIRVFEQMLDLGVSFVVLGTGDYHFENFFKDKAREHPGQVAAVTSFSAPLANRIYAGADLFLMPSISEPCGLAQMIAMRYGTIPIVRATGGLKDSVKPYNPETGKGTGINFESVNAHDMLDAIYRAVTLYKDEEAWEKLMKNAFSADFSWKRSALEYIKLYNSLVIT